VNGPVGRWALSSLSIVDYIKTWNDCQYRIAAGSLLGAVKVATATRECHRKFATKEENERELILFEFICRFLTEIFIFFSKAGL
jgi:hypothetical protein